jgi:hypothetical protein
MYRKRNTDIIGISPPSACGEPLARRSYGFQVNLQFWQRTLTNPDMERNRIKKRLWMEEKREQRKKAQLIGFGEGARSVALLF